MTIKSFRGLLADGATERINLKTNTGKIGYRIVKFQIIGSDPVDVVQESVVAIWTEDPNLPTATSHINFSDQSLLAAGVWANNSTASNYGTNTIVIFDNMLVNQDIFVTHKEKSASQGCNYYIELEQIKLSDNESTMATLQSIRSRYESYTPAGPT